MQVLKKYPILCLLFVCAVLFLSNLDILMVNIMEARNFISAREMITDDHWILTTLNGEPRYEKPPLPTWTTALFATVFGFKNLFALRIPAVLMGILIVLTSYKFSLKIFKNKTVAFLGGLIVSTSFYVIYASRHSNWDIFAVAFIILCIYQLFLLFTSKKYQYVHAILAAIFLGCSALSKGPVAMYALLLPFLISYLTIYRFKEISKWWRPFFFFLGVGSILSCSWYTYVYHADPEGLITVVQREANNWLHYNVRPFYYYWNFFIQTGYWTILAAVGLCYPYLKDKVSNKKGYKFTMLWTVISLILLSIIPEKKSKYLLPVLIPLALNTAFYVEYILNYFRSMKSNWERVPIVFHFICIGVGGILVPIVGYILLQDNLSEHWIWFILLSISSFCVGVIVLLKLYRRDIRAAFYTSIIGVLFAVLFMIPLISSFTTNPDFNSFSRLKDWQEEHQISVYEFAETKPEHIWFYGDKIKVLTTEEGIELPTVKSFGILVGKKKLQEFKSVFKGFEIKKITRYDMNVFPPGSKNHKTRLWRELYKVSRE